MHPFLKLGLLLIVVAIGVSVILFGISRERILDGRNQIVGYDQEIQYDDFAFSVFSTDKLSSLGGTTAQDIFYLVALKVANHAKRVPFIFNPNIVIVIDSAGVERHFSVEGQRALRALSDLPDPCADALPAGATCLTELVFDVPTDTSPHLLRISFGGAVGDVLDTIFSGNKAIELH